MAQKNAKPWQHLQPPDLMFPKIKDPEETMAELKPYNSVLSTLSIPRLQHRCKSLHSSIRDLSSLEYRTWDRESCAGPSKDALKRCCAKHKRYSSRSKGMSFSAVISLPGLFRLAKSHSACVVMVDFCVGIEVFATQWQLVRSNRRRSVYSPFGIFSQI